MEPRTKSQRWLAIGGAATVVISCLLFLGIGIFIPDPNLVTTFHLPERGVITTVAISENGHSIAAGDKGGMVRVWTIQEGIYKRQERVYQSEISTLAFSADNQYLMVGVTDEAIFVWDITAGTAPRSIFDTQTEIYSSHGKDILSIAAHPNGSIIAVSVRNIGVQLVDVKSGGILHTFEKQASDESVKYLAFNSDGSMLMMAYNDASVYIAKVNEHQVICKFDRISEDLVSSAVFTKEDHVRIGTHLLVEEWSVTTCSHVWHGNVTHPRRIRILTLSPDSVFVVLSGAQRTDLLNGFPIIGQPDSSLSIKNIDDPQTSVQLHGHTQYVMDAQISQNGQLLVSGSYDGTVRLWRVPDFDE